MIAPLDPPPPFAINLVDANLVGVVVGAVAVLASLAQLVHAFRRRSETPSD